MRRLIWTIALALMLGLPALGQTSNPDIFYFAGVPSGNCGTNTFSIDAGNGVVYYCVSGSWTPISTTGSGSVSAVSGDGTLITNSGSTGSVTLTTGTAPTHKFWNGAWTQPACGDLSNAGTACQVTAPANTSSTSHQWFNSYTAATGVFGKAQPAISDLTATFNLPLSLSTNTLSVNLGTTLAPGVLQPDGTTITVSAGVISAVSGGSGTVTSFSAGTLSPLFTTSVANPTTTPALSFSLSNAAQNSVLAGPASGGAGAPSYQTAPTIAVTNMTGTGAFSTSGNAGTATAAASLGTECSAGQAARGVDTGWNARDCFTPTGSGTVNSGTGGTPAVYLTTGTAVSSGSGETFNGSGALLNLAVKSSGTTAGFADTGTTSALPQVPGSFGYNTTDIAWELMTAWQDNSIPALDLQAAYATSQDTDSQNLWQFQYWPIQIARIEKSVANSYAVLASVGDSDTSGFGSTQLSWLYPFVTMEQLGWGSAGVGFATSNAAGALKNALPAGVTGANSGTWTYCGWSGGTVTNGHSGACWGPDNTDATASANGAYQQYTATGTNFFVHAACQSGGASLHIFVDGADTANASTNCTPGTVVSVSSGNQTEGSHVIKAQQVGSGTLTFTGYFGYDTTLGHGVTVLKMGAASTSAIDFATNPNLGAEFTQIQADLVSVFGTGVTTWTEMTGANENNQAETPAAMITAINTIVGDMHTASSLADIAVLSDPDDGNNTGLTASGWQYEKAIQGYDNLNRYPFVSMLRHTYPETTNSPSNRACFASDNIHLGPNCQQVMASVMMERMQGSRTNPFAASTGTGTANYIAKWTSTSVLGNSQADDGVTNANTLTYVGSGGAAIPNGPLTVATVLKLSEGSCPAGATGYGFICSSSSNHQLGFSNAGSAYASFVGSAASLTSTALVTGAGLQNVQTPSAGSTLDSSGNLTIAGKYNGLTLTALTGGFTIQGGTSSKTLTINNTLALSGTDSTTMTFPSTSATIARTDAGQTFTGANGFTNSTFNESSIGTSTGTGQSIAGTSLTAGDIYYVGSGGLALAEANASSTVPAVCIATTTTACTYSGVYRFGSSQSWTAGNILYVSDSSAGAIVNTAPSTSGHFVQRIGIALANDTILMQPSIDVAAIQ